MGDQDRERGDIILGWLTKLTATLAVVGVIGFDAISLGSASFRAEDQAQTAARAAVETYRGTKDLQKAYDAALAEVDAVGTTLDPAAFTAGPDGSITLHLTREVPTLLVEKIPPLRDLTVVTRTVTGSPAR